MSSVGIEISVLITAYNRKKYLKEAVRSVLESSINRDLYEIIVVKNFTEIEIDSFLSQNQVIVVNTTDENIGKQIALGLDKASGAVISFLDDDDKFEQDKLSIVLSEFKDPSLIYYHNLSSPIGEDSTLLKGSVIQPIKTQLFLLPDTVENLIHSLSTREDMTHYTLMFNLSCVSMRKEVLLKNRVYLERIIDGTDHFAFYISIMENMKMKFDVKYLTLYRIHKSASNLLSGEFIPRKIGLESVRLFLEPNHYSKVLDEATRGTKTNSLIKCKLLEESLLLNVLSLNRKRYFRFADFFHYLHCLKVNSRPSVKNYIVRFLFVTIALILPYPAGVFYLMRKYRKYRNRLDQRI